MTLALRRLACALALGTILVASGGCGDGEPVPPAPPQPTAPAPQPSEGTIPDHETAGATCADNGITVNPPYIMDPWYPDRLEEGKAEQVRYRPHLYVLTSNNEWAHAKAGTLWGAAATEDGLVEVYPGGILNKWWTPLEERDPSGKSFGALEPGSYRTAVEFIWPAANESVTEWAGSHYYFDSGESAEFCEFRT